MARKVNMYQQEFKFFWPLTEQIDLPLDYSECGKKPTPISSDNTFNIMYVGHPSVSISAGKFEVPNLTMRYKKKPNLVRRVLLKLLGMDWKQDNE